MERSVNWDEVAEGGAIPSDYYEVRIYQWDEERTKSNNALMYKLTYLVEGEGPYAGTFLYDRFPVGTLEFPDDIVPSAFGTRRLKTFLQAVGVPLGGMPSTLDMALERTVMTFVEIEEYQGEKRNTVKSYHPLVAPAPRPLAGRQPAAPSAQATTPANPQARRPRNGGAVPAGMAQRSSGRAPQVTDDEDIPF